MSEQKYISIYLRKTNGSGQKIAINSKSSIHQLYNMTQKYFKLSQFKFDLFYKGDLLPNNKKSTLQKLNINQSSIIHVKQKPIKSQQNIQIRIFCQDQIYNYKTYNKNLILSLKQYLVSIIHCYIDDITISYLGKILENHQNFQQNSIHHHDLLSVTLTTQPFDHMNQLQLQAKLVESVTFSSTQINAIDHQFSKQNQLTPTIKSTQDLHPQKNINNKQLLKSQLIKSQSQVSSSHQRKQPQNNYFNIKFQGFHKNKIIQTESITLDDPDYQQDYQKWAQCQIQFINQNQTQQYIIQCNQTHNIASVLSVLSKKLRKKPSQLLLIFPNQNSQKIAQSGKPVIEIAKNQRSKIIQRIIFQ